MSRGVMVLRRFIHHDPHVTDELLRRDAHVISLIFMSIFYNNMRVMAFSYEMSSLKKATAKFLSLNRFDRIKFYWKQILPWSDRYNI